MVYNYIVDSIIWLDDDTRGMVCGYEMVERPHCRIGYVTHKICTFSLQ